MTQPEGNCCDLLVISPHTDDAEIGLGGTIRLLADRGRRVWAVDLTRGELGTNATVAERWSEAEKASAVLGLAGRAQLELPDGFIDSTDRDQVAQVVGVIRRLQPRWIVTAPDPVRHPDHQETPKLVERAAFLARLVAWQTPAPGGTLWSGGAPWPEAAERWETESVFSVCPDDGQPAVIFYLAGQGAVAGLLCQPVFPATRTQGHLDQRHGLSGKNRAPGADLGPSRRGRTGRGLGKSLLSGPE